jgi:hypothetical protein
MKFAILLFIAVFPLSNSLFSKDMERDKTMWTSAYHGDFSLVHKMALAREVEDVNDAIINQFVMAYVYYKREEYHQVDRIFKEMDNYIEHFFIPEEK